MTQVTAKDIADFLSRDLIGDNVKVNRPAALHDVTSNSVFFIKKSFDNYEHIPADSLAIVKDSLKLSLPSAVIKTSNPRLDFINVVKHFFAKRIAYGIHPDTDLPKSSQIHAEVFIGKNVTVEENVNIARGCEIFSNVYIGKGVSIGENCVIKPGAVIGTSGFGYDFAEDGTPEYFPHLGSVVVGKNVHIGANSTIDCGTLGNTVIEDNVKIDNLVHIAHNCHIKENCIITACAEISGGVTIEPGSWISPNVSIKQKIRIGREALVGLGSVVIKDVGEREKVMGLDAMKIRDYLSLKKKL